MSKSFRKLRPKWLRPPQVPLVYLLFVALPLSIWQSPGVDRQATTILIASFVLLILVAATATKAPLPWTRVHFTVGAAIALFHTHFHANERAGIMLLFLPLAATLAGSRALPRKWRLQCGLLILLFGGTLLAAGSRGGILALLAAVSVSLILERRWRLLLLGLVLAAGLASPEWQAIESTSGPIDWLIHDGKAQGLTLDSLLTGRPNIWRRALHAIADFSWTGIGIGTYSEVVPILYYPAGTRGLEDAHSLVLQTALDLGVLGLLAMATIVWFALRRAYSAWQRAPVASVRRIWAHGLFVTLLAYGAFNLVDAVALGSPGSLPFFILLGLIYALPRPRRRHRRVWHIPARIRGRLLLGAIFMLLGLSSIRGSRQLNHAAVTGAHAMVHDPSLLPAAYADLTAASHHTCRASWLKGKVAQAWGRPRLRDDAWADLMHCSAAFVPLIASELPQHPHLANQAVELQPASAAAHLWLAHIRLKSHDREAAKELYRRSLDIDPTNGAAWLEFGRLLAPEDPHAALDAFIKSCHHGDPGANGCLAAGAAAEQLEDIDLAIRYYRKSRLTRGRKRAERMEDQKQD